MSKLINDCCKNVIGVLKEHRDGIRMERLYSAVNKNKFGKDIVDKAVHQLYRTNCMIQFVSRNPQTIRLRERTIATTLKDKCSDAEHSIYTYIEECHTNGIWIKILKEKAGLTNDESKKIIKKLSGLQLIAEVTHPQKRRKMLYITKCIPKENKYQSIFFFKSGKIDESFVNQMYLRVKEHFFDAKYKGLSCKQVIEKEHHSVNPITTLKQIPILDMQKIINLLLFDGVIEVIPNSIPIDIRDEYCNSTQNTVCQIVKGIDHKRDKFENFKLKKSNDNSNDNNNSGNIYGLKRKFKMLDNSSTTVDNSDDIKFGTESYQRLLESRFAFTKLEPKFDEMAIAMKGEPKMVKKEESRNNEASDDSDDSLGQPPKKRQKLNDGKSIPGNKKISIKYEESNNSNDKPIIKKEESNKFDMNLDDFNFDEDDSDDIRLHSPIKTEEKIEKMKKNEIYKGKENSKDEKDDLLIKFEQNIQRYDEMKYRMSTYHSDSPFVYIPCNACPVRHKCTPNGIVSPSNCVYFNAWLDIH